MGKSSRACNLVVRLLAAAATLSAAIVMATSHETTTFFNLTFEAKFQYTPAFKFFVIVNAIAAVYTVLTLFVSPGSHLCRAVVVMDVVVGMMLMAAIAAAGAMAQVGKHGNKHAGWLPICGQTHKFCDQVMWALICGLVGVATYFGILMYTIYTVLGSSLIP